MHALQKAHPCLCPLNVRALHSKSIVICVVQFFDKPLILEEWVVLESEGDLVA